MPWCRHPRALGVDLGRCAKAPHCRSFDNTYKGHFVYAGGPGLELTPAADLMLLDVELELNRARRCPDRCRTSTKPPATPTRWLPSIGPQIAWRHRRCGALTGQRFNLLGPFQRPSSPSVAEVSVELARLEDDDADAAVFRVARAVARVAE